jgi:CRISPR-associated endonuclease Csn1
MSKTILGLDLGSNSLGWSLLSADDAGQPTDIIDIGVRIFQKSVQEKTPTPKNQQRRTKRLARRTIQRRARRKLKLLNYLIRLNLLPTELSGNLQPEGILNGIGDPYQLRAKAPDEDLTAYELGRVLLHLVQRRGFLSNKKTLLGRDMLDDPDVISVLGDDTDPTDSAEETAFKADISLLRAEINKLEPPDSEQESPDSEHKKTLGKYLASLPKHECKRNRDGNHIRTDRQMYLDELSLIFKKQSVCHPVLTEDVQLAIKEIIFFQRPLKLKDDRIGKCSLEPNKKRSAISRLEYQRFRYLQDINNLTYFCPNTEQWVKLNDQDKEKLRGLFEVSKELTFARIKKELALKRNIKLNLETRDKPLKGNTTVFSISEVYSDWHTLDALQQRAFVEDLISIKKKSALKRRLVSHWGLNGEDAVRVCMVELEPGYGSVSLKAINKLLPHLEAGLIYSDARVAAGYDYEKEEIEIESKLGMPPELPNPIVMKGLHELRRVVNALIAEHGKPDIIRIEMARDLEMNTKRYKAHEARQKLNTKLNDEAQKAYQNVGIEHPKLQLSKYPSRDQKIKYRLWKDQNMCCAYSGKTISLGKLFSADIEIDHILPYSHSLDDSYMNKVVCYAKENQVKGQRTPMDAFGANEEKWEQITQAIQRIPKQLSKKRDAFYKTSADLSDHDFIGSQLTDTRYMSKVAGTYLESLGSDITFTRGIMTSWLRYQWDFNSLISATDNKERGDHRHHAIDAVVTACIDRNLYQTLVEVSRSLERSQSSLSMRDVYIDPTINDFKDKLKTKLDQMIVAHAPNRKLTDALHEETGVGFIEGIGTVYRKRLNEDFELKHAKNIIDDNVREIVTTHLEKHNGKPKLAFAPGFKLYNTGGEILIKRVRVVQATTSLEKLENTKLAIKDKAGKAFKWHAYGNNHHVEILKNRGNNKYKSEFVTTFEASQRARTPQGNGTQIIQQNHGDEWEFLMALHKNDLVRLTVDGQKKIYRVQVLEGAGKIIIRDHRAATLNNPQKMLRKSISTLLETYEMTPIKINAIGKLLDD